jgi:hypothetical protein
MATSLRDFDPSQGRVAPEVDRSPRLQSIDLSAVHPRKRRSRSPPFHLRLAKRQFDPLSVIAPWIV